MKPSPFLKNSPCLSGLDKDYIQSIFLYQNNVKYHPNSWKAHYDLGYVYKEKGETLLAKEELLRSKELNPENDDIENLLDELNL